MSSAAYHALREVKRDLDDLDADIKEDERPLLEDIEQVLDSLTHETPATHPLQQTTAIRGLLYSPLDAKDGVSSLGRRYPLYSSLWPLRDLYLTHPSATGAMVRNVVEKRSTFDPKLRRLLRPIVFRIHGINRMCSLLIESNERHRPDNSKMYQKLLNAVEQVLCLLEPDGDSCTVAIALCTAYYDATSAVSTCSDIVNLVNAYTGVEKPQKFKRQWNDIYTSVWGLRKHVREWLAFSLRVKIENKCCTCTWVSIGAQCFPFFRVCCCRGPSFRVPVHQAMKLAAVEEAQTRSLELVKHVNIDILNALI